MAETNIRIVIPAKAGIQLIFQDDEKSVMP